MTTEPLIDAAARYEIAHDLTRNLCVEAGAGTGKTTVLVDRVVNLLAEGVVEVDQLVVITFTDKAAAELSTRIRDQLEVRASEASGPELDRIVRAAQDLYRAHIETIHTFAAGLLRERPVEARIDPLFEVLQGVGASLDFDRLYERFQDRLLAQDLPELTRALRRGFGLQELQDLCKVLGDYRYLIPLQIQTTANSGDAIVEDAVDQLRDTAQELRELLERQRPPQDDPATVNVNGILGWIEDLLHLPLLDRERMLVFEPPAKTHGSAGRAQNWGGEKPLLLDLQKQYKAAVEEARQDLRTDALLGLLPHAEAFVEECSAERRRAGTPDFDDLLYWARDLLRDSAAARTYFRRRYRAVLLDEFQDTDPVQAELALLLTSTVEPPGQWRGLEPGPGRLTVVGDPKQSIYRFRRADIKVYDDVRTEALRGGEERISTNFRSNPGLLQALNTAFDRILQPLTGVQPGNVPLAPPPDAIAADRPPVVVLEGHAASGRGQADEIRREDARLLVSLLHRAHDEGWRVRDRKTRQLRPCRWGDQAILFPTRTGIGHFEEALATAGIPYRHEGSRDFFERPEVRDLVWILSAIDDPTDRLALVGALRSAAFAISDEDLLLHVAATGALTYRRRVESPVPALRTALDELRDLHYLRQDVSLSELVRRTLERNHLVEQALTATDGEQRAANLLAIVDTARLFAEAGGGGLRPFIRHLHGLMEENVYEMEATIAEETDDVVRLMTVHGAKGLEFPIVALANLWSRPNFPVTAIPQEADSTLSVRVGADSKGRHGHFETPHYQAAVDDEKAMGEAERLRLLYVAATRARDHLVIPCASGRANATDLLQHLVGALPDDPMLVATIDGSTLEAPAMPPVLSADVDASAVEASVEERDAWREAHGRLLTRAGTERQIETASSRERARGPLAAEVSTFDAALLVSDGPPIPVGDAVHMVMERVRLADAADLEAVADDVCLEGGLPAEREDVIAMCRACLRARAVQRAVTDGTWWREVPFALSRANAGSSLVTGRVDLVTRDGDELVVIDYKTDRDVTAETAIDHTKRLHGGQAEVYQLALSEATGLRVREVVFVYCRAGVEVTVRPGEVSAISLA